ncbi:hypothetical protein Mmc1_1724 [Magnetococcus marinus MC-1]|uniref:Uncharacterized protein n=1 Tax=Magnetococcus marinus (strain ATCC BAA-1437 / JCM 17883 / MC-1) TaxID=156889 RepID=A0L8D9_MAGMM|nr:hypothetical protein [Magnetococcus marinus]ABK44232.1 hypothetical protein Mmc1_1724 [Magnetococcus marinus MC-1]
MADQPLTQLPALLDVQESDLLYAVRDGQSKQLDVATLRGMNEGLYAPVSHGHSLSDITDAGQAAALAVGTTPGTVAAGDHNHSGLYQPHFTSSYTLPSADGSSGQVPQTNGAGVVSWVDMAAGGGGATALNELSDVAYLAGASGYVIMDDGVETPQPGQIAIGDLNGASYAGAISIGMNVTTTGLNAVVIGAGASGGVQDVALGYGATATGYGVAVGTNAKAKSACVAIGRNTGSSGSVYSFVAIGDGVTGSDYSSAVGANAVNGQGSCILGNYASAAYWGHAIGRYATAGNYATAIGTSSNAYAHSIAIGQSAATTSAGEVVLRANAIDLLRISSAGVAIYGGAYTLPITDGSAGQVLQTDGAGNLSWVTL